MEAQSGDVTLAAKTETQLHKIATARQETGNSQRAVARQLGITVARLRTTENEGHDVWVSELHLLSEAIGVPVEDLLVDPEMLSESAELEQTALAEVAQTINALEQQVDSDEAKVLVRMLSEQLRQLRG